MRFIIPILLLVASIASFVMFTNPTYSGPGGVKELSAQIAQYNEALTNSQKLQEQRDALAAKYQSISPDSLARLSKLLPDNPDNIHLIIDIQRMAQSYGISITSIKFDANQDGTATAAGGNTQLAAGNAAAVATALKDYGIFNLEFSITATYENFLKFIKDVESSLRLSDIQSIEFTSNDPTKQVYTFTVKMRTYWLKK